MWQMTGVPANVPAIDASAEQVTVGISQHEAAELRYIRYVLSLINGTVIIHICDACLMNLLLITWKLWQRILTSATVIWETM